MDAATLRLCRLLISCPCLVWRVVKTDLEASSFLGGRTVQEFEVQVEADHIQRITSAKPLAAISELIWNAYDADARKVTVDFVAGPVRKLDRIVVSDDGNGIPFDEAETFFRSLGGSWKKLSRLTVGGRRMHGAMGQGRFKAFALGSDVTWVSQADGKQFDIEGNIENLKRFSISDVSSTSQHGCTVEIANVFKDFEIRAGNGFATKIRDVFALQLYEDPHFSIVYDGEAVDAREAILNVETYDIDLSPDTHDGVGGTLDVVEWRGPIERNMMLCLPGRFAFHSLPPGIHARGFNFTAYLTSPYFQSLIDSNTEGLVELDPTSSQLIEAAKDRLREHFRARETHKYRDRIREWREAGVYPYVGDANTAVERNERQIFDVVALYLDDYSSDFERSGEKQKKLVLRLLKLAVESGPSSLPTILEHVVDLPEGKQEELANLLRKTSLVSVINAAKSVTDRLDFLKALQILIFSPKSKKQLLERSQLHRILAGETWIFGEQFNLMNDDEDLTSVLRAHLKLLGADRSELSPVKPVLDASGKSAVVDLMLSCLVPMPTDERRHHLVVELKRPSQPVNEDVLLQIKKYAKAVASDDRFRLGDVQWDFLVVSNNITPDAELDTRQAGWPVGLVAQYENPTIRVWAKTWGQIIGEAEGRLTFFKRKLNYQANDEEALRYLSQIDSSYLSEEVKQKIADLEAAE